MTCISTVPMSLLISGLTGTRVLYTIRYPICQDNPVCKLSYTILTSRVILGPPHMYLIGPISSFLLVSQSMCTFLPFPKDTFLLYMIYMFPPFAGTPLSWILTKGLQPYT